MSINSQVWRPNPVMWPFSWNFLAVLSLESHRFSVCLEIKSEVSRICMCHLGGANRDHMYRKWPNKRPGRLFYFGGLSERGVYSRNCNKLKKLILYAFGKNIKRVKKRAEYPLRPLICLGRLEIHVALSTPNNDVRTLAQGYCIAIISLSLLWSWHWTRWNTQTLVSQTGNWMNCSFLLRVILTVGIF